MNGHSKICFPRYGFFFFKKTDHNYWYMYIYLEEKYLGHIILNYSKDNNEMMHRCHQLYACGNVLFRKCHMCSMDVKIKFFHTYCSPMYSRSNHTTHMFHRLHNNILSRLVGRPRFCITSGLFAERRQQGSYA